MRHHAPTLNAALLEMLERRRLLAGNVTATYANGDLTVRGDAEDNAIVVARATAGRVRVSGADDTTVNGQPFFEFADAIDDARFFMAQGGADDLAIAGGIRVEGDLRATMGEGLITIDGTLGRVRVGGNLAIGGDADVSILNDVGVVDEVGIASGGRVDVAAGKAKIPSFLQADFSNSLDIDNPYFPLIVGTIYTYEAEVTDEDTGEVLTEIVVVEVLEETRTIAGVVARVVRDTVTIDGVLVEDTFDWFAQDDEGNVWYMGEDVTNYNYDEDGNLIGTDDEGSFEAGVDGARAGVNMEAAPRVGDRYFQEVAPRNALDQATVLSLDAEADVPAGAFEDVLQTSDFTVLEADGLEHKFYAPGLGNVLSAKLDPHTGGIVETTELISVTLNGQTVTQVVSPDDFEGGANPNGHFTRGARFRDDVAIGAGESIVVLGALFAEDAALGTQGALTVRDASFEQASELAAGESAGLRRTTILGNAQLTLEDDLFIFNSRFSSVLADFGPTDDTFVVGGSRFASLDADGGEGDNVFEEDNSTFDELTLTRFTNS